MGCFIFSIFHGKHSEQASQSLQHSHKTFGQLVINAGENKLKVFNNPHEFLCPLTSPPSQLMVMQFPAGSSQTEREAVTTVTVTVTVLGSLVGSKAACPGH